LIGYYLVAVSLSTSLTSQHEQHGTDHQSFGAPYVLLLSLAAANTSGSTKKAITSGAVFIGEFIVFMPCFLAYKTGYNVGNIAAAYLVFSEEKPIKYRSTWISVIVGMVFTIFASLLLRFLYVRENRRRDTLSQLQAESVQPSRAGSQEKLYVGEDRIVEKLEEYRDLTDKQRRDFRYVY
jgi:hypothetical protein